MNGIATIVFDCEPHAPCTRCSVSAAAVAKSTTACVGSYSTSISSHASSAT